MTIAVLGAGNSGRAWAAHLSLAGYEVRLWNREVSGESGTVTPLILHATGAVQGSASVDCLTDSLATAIDGARIVVVATPATAHADLGRALARVGQSCPPVLLSPGRTLGCFDFVSAYGNGAPAVAEAQTVLHTSRQLDSDCVHVFSVKQTVEIAGANAGDTDTVLRALPGSVRPLFRSVSTSIRTSLGNVGAVLHPAPMLLNAGWVEGPSAFRFYADGVSDSVARVMHRLDDERLLIASRLGVQVPSLAEWFTGAYGRSGSTIAQIISGNPAYQTIDAPTALSHRYLMEDVACGLARMEALALGLGVGVKAMSTVIDLANMVLALDFRRAGRGAELAATALDVWGVQRGV